MPLPVLHTPRLDLHPATPADLDNLCLLWNDPDVRRYLFDDQPVTRERTAEALANCLNPGAEGVGLWTVRIRPEAPIVGCVGLLPTMVAEYAPTQAGAIEPLAAFSPAVWGNGYAHESLAAVITYGFDTLKLSRLAGANDVPNAPSDRMLRRLGFTVTGECAGPHYRLRLYALTPEQFTPPIS